MERPSILTMLILGGCALWVFVSWRRRKDREGMIYIRPIAAPSHTLRNIFVLLIVVGCVWWFWFVAGTKCAGGC